MAKHAWIMMLAPLFMGMSASLPIAQTPQPGQAKGAGVLPPKVSSVVYTGALVSVDPNGATQDVARDLGYSGVINNQIAWTFGDTLMGDGSGNYTISATDSVGIGDMLHPMTVHDVALWMNSDRISEWIPANKAENANGGLGRFSFGGTNIVEYAPNKGLVFYLKNNRGPGGDGVEGAGVASVSVDGNGIPRARRAGDHMWASTEPAWGDVGIAYNAQDGYVYAFGHGPNLQTPLGLYVYLCRAPAAQATHIGAYEYFRGDMRTWTKQRLGDGSQGTFALTPNQAVFGWADMNQSAPFWSNYFNKWMFLYGNSFGSSDVLVKTADHLEGPWTSFGTVASTCPTGACPGYRYAHTAHPEFDPSGKSVLVTWTRNNVIYGATITWQ